MVVVSFKIPSDALEEIEQLAKRLGMSRSDFIRNALRNYINKIIMDLEGGNMVEIDGRVTPLKIRVVRLAIPTQDHKRGRRR